MAVPGEVSAFWARMSRQLFDRCHNRVQLKHSMRHDPCRRRPRSLKTSCGECCSMVEPDTSPLQRCAASGHGLRRQPAAGAAGHGHLPVALHSSMLNTPLEHSQSSYTLCCRKLSQSQRTACRWCCRTRTTSGFTQPQCLCGRMTKPSYFSATGGSRSP